MRNSHGVTPMGTIWLSKNVECMCVCIFVCVCVCVYVCVCVSVCESCRLANPLLQPATFCHCWGLAAPTPHVLARSQEAGLNRANASCVCVCVCVCVYVCACVFVCVRVYVCM